MVKDKIKYFEELSDKQVPTIRLHKIPVSLQNMRDEELGRARDNHHFKICFTIDYNRCLGTNHNKHCY